MLVNEAGPRDWAPAEPVPSARAVSALSVAQVSYTTLTVSDRRRYAFAALVMGATALLVGFAPHVFHLNGWIVASTGLSAVLIGAVAMHHAPWLGSFGRIGATLGMTMGLAAATLMLLPFL
ncbi:hypothetical protein ACFFGH_28560 [Lysobacter korlensis]|uniref:FUSC family protein n=1 Tax=Lysobacter korlensis TaxID=553636 RepID=A0ABV6S0Y7_9GAMM